MNKVLGYRKMIGLTQTEMAEKLGISEATYRAKEKGRSHFTNQEILIFIELIKESDPFITFDDIFFSKNPTKKDER